MSCYDYVTHIYYVLSRLFRDNSSRLRVIVMSTEPHSQANYSFQYDASVATLLPVPDSICSYVFAQQCFVLA